MSYEKTNWIDNVTPVGAVNMNKIEQGIEDLDTGKEPIIETKNTAFNQRFETSIDNIKMNGAVSVGTSDNVARADHVHANDTTKANVEDLSTTNGNVATNTENIASNASSINSVASQLQGHKDSTVAHDAENITYSGDVVASDVKGALNKINERVGTIVAGAGTSNTEILDARYDNINSKTYDTLGKRMDGFSSELVEVPSKRPSMIPNTLAKLNRGEDVIISCVGDSIVNGVLPSGLLVTEGYVYLFAQKIATKYPNSTVIIVIGATTNNTEDRPIDTWTETILQTGTNGQTIRIIRNGVGGDTLLRLYRRMNDIIQYQGKKPDLITIMEGINDMISFDNKKYAPLDRYEKGLKTFIQYLKREVRCELVLQSIHWFQTSTPNTDVENRIAIQQRVALSEQIQFVNQHETWVNHYQTGVGIYGQDNWLVDGDMAHPTKYGQPSLSDRLFRDLFEYNQTISAVETPKNSIVKYNDSKITYTGTWFEKAISNNSNITYYVQRVASNGSLSVNLKGKKIYILARIGLALGSFDVTVDSGTSTTISVGTSYPSDYTDVSDGSICSYFYERILIYDGGYDTEHTIDISNATSFEYYGFEVTTDYPEYYSQQSSSFPTMNSGVVSITGTGVTYAVQDITFSKTHNTIPNVVATTSDKDYIVAIVPTANTNTTCAIWIGKKDGTVFSNTINVTYISIDS